MSPRKPAASAQKTKAQELAEAVNAALGKDTLKMGNHEDFKVSFIPSGLLPIDILLQGGMPRGRMVELFGDYSTLKSYVGLNIAREVQMLGGVAALIDTEHAFDPGWATNVGVDVSQLIVEHPPNGEKAMDIMETLVRGKIDQITVDSIAATLPQAEQEKRLHDEKIQPGRLAALMSAGLRRINTANTETSLLWINQTRTNIGITFGSPEAIPGGKAMPYYASYRLALRKTGKITQDVKFYNGEAWASGKEQIGQKFKAELLKSKLSKPFRDIWFNWNLTTGQIDIPSFLVSQGVDLGLIEIKGNTWWYGNTKAVGRKNFYDLIADSPTLMHDMDSEIREHYDLPVLAAPRGPKKVVTATKVKAPVKKTPSKRIGKK